MIPGSLCVISDLCKLSFLGFVLGVPEFPVLDRTLVQLSCPSCSCLVDSGAPMMSDPHIHAVLWQVAPHLLLPTPACRGTGLCLNLFSAHCLRTCASPYDTLVESPVGVSDEPRKVLPLEGWGGQLPEAGVGADSTHPFPAGLSSI